MSNSHAQHGVVVPAWDTVAVKATLKPSMGVALTGQTVKKSLAALFSFIPIEQPFEQWSRAAQAKFVPTRVAVPAGNKRLVNGSCPIGQTVKRLQG